MPRLAALLLDSERRVSEQGEGRPRFVGCLSVCGLDGSSRCLVSLRRSGGPELFSWIAMSNLGSESLDSFSDATRDPVNQGAEKRRGLGCRFPPSWPLSWLLVRYTCLNVCARAG